jgi:hypothetical protein
MNTPQLISFACSCMTIGLVICAIGVKAATHRGHKIAKEIICEIRADVAERNDALAPTPPPKP